MPDIAIFHPQIVHFVIALLVVGVVFRVVLPTERGLGLPTVTMLLWSAAEWAIVGAIAGFWFALFLATDAACRIDALTPGRALRWGAFGAILLPAASLLGMYAAGGSVHWSLLQVLVEWAFAGAICGAGTVMLARRPIDRELTTVSGLAGPAPAGAAGH